MTDRQIHPLVMTMGEPAGIGGEIAIKAWQDRLAMNIPDFFILDDPDRLKRLGKRIGMEIPVKTISSPGEVAATYPDALPVMPLGTAIDVEPGIANPEYVSTVLESIDRAVDYAVSGDVSGIVTNPIHKKTLYDGGFRHPGHTEYLALKSAAGTMPVMMLTCPGLRVVPVTIHMALREAVDALNTDVIIANGIVTAEALQRDYGIEQPRLAVAGLNPHAGEDNAMGDDEEKVIAPAVRALQAKGIDCFGPAPADTLFHAAARSTYDAVLCMYHDQALIPLKTIDFERGVNVTLGLPFVRTSPDHGTAFNIAGSGTASPLSLIAAIREAASMAAQRDAVRA
jgi:4-hydroxythreonine-4-phosphate dehydrogenase